jgi:hypothetical protein
MGIGYTTTGSGSLSSLPFVPPGTPGLGDKVTIRDGHTLTQDIPWAVGPGNDVAIQVGDGSGAGDAKLIVNAPLTCNGHLSGYSALSKWSLVQINSGGGIELDGGSGFIPCVQANGNGNYGQGPYRVIFNGTANTPAYLRTKASKVAAGEHAHFRNVAAGVPDVDYADFDLACEGQWGVIQDFGDTTYYGTYFSHPKLRPGTTGRAVLSDTLFLRTSFQFYGNVGSASADDGLTLRRCKFRQATQIMDSGVYNLSAKIDGKGYGSRALLDLDECGFDLPIFANGLDNVTNTSITYGFSCSDSPGKTLFEGTWANNLVGQPVYPTTISPSDPVLKFLTNSTGATTYGRTYIVYHGATGNPHIAFPSFTTAGTLTFDDWTWEAPIVREAPGGGFCDDCCDAWQTPVGSSFHINGPLLLPPLGGDHPGSGIGFGCIGNASQSTGGQCYIDRMTLVHYGNRELETADGRLAIDATSGHGGIENAVAQLTNSLFYSYNPGHTVFNIIGSLTNPVILSGVHHNCLYNGTYGLPTAPSGTGDIHVDPQMLDESRNIISWWRTQVGSADPNYVSGQTPETDMPKVIAYFAANPGSIAAMADWVRAGWAPTNAALKGAASDGGDIGAVPAQAAASFNPAWIATSALIGMGVY